MYPRLLLFLAASLSIAAAADVRVVEEIVAKVNSDIITRGELEHNRQEYETELRQQGLSGAKLQQAVKAKAGDALQNQIDQLLLVQKAKDLNISVDAEVTKRLAEIQVQSKITDPDQFHDFIREQTGMSYEDFKQMQKNQLLTQKVIGQEVSSRINIPEPEKRKYYEEHKKDYQREEQVFLQQIVISTEGKTPEQVTAAEKKAKDLVARARKGEKFGDLAATNSDDIETARNGGELPAYKRSEHLLRKEIEDIVFAQKKGYVTDPIRVTNGFLILRVADRYEAGLATYEEVENEIGERMAMPQMQTKVRAYLTKLREDAFLEIKPGYVDTGAAPGKDTSWKEVAQLKPQTVTKEEVATHKKRKRLLKIIPVPFTGGTVKPKATQPASPPPAAAPAPPTTAAAPAADPAPAKP
ncbi:MAG: peptidylprolyl isomerase [Bryobacteraceae bacterium]|jgi:parvulin-like peptidyl-prolyl isomerase